MSKKPINNSNNQNNNNIKDNKNKKKKNINNERRQQIARDVCVNETTEESQSEKENDFIGVVERSLPSVTYPSGKEIFSFADKDSDLSFLNYESPIKIVKVNVSSTTEDSTPIASPLRKRGVDTIVRSKLYICELKSKLLAAETKVKQLQGALKTQKTKNSRLTKRLQKKVDKKFVDIDDLLKEKYIPDMAKTMLKLQMHKPNTPYTTNEKDLAKQIYFHSAACYSRFSAESTVRSWVAECEIVPGINDGILKKIGEYLMLLSPQKRLCALKFDEMSIRAAEEYSKKYGVIEGLVDMGRDRRDFKVAKYALLFCIRWRQIVAFGFNENGASAEELFEIVPQIMLKLRKVGSDIRVIVCDQGSNNQK